MAEEKRPKYWLHRITGGKNAWQMSDHLFRKHNLISIGWSDFSTDEFVEGVRSKGIEYMNEWIKDEWKISNLPRSRWSLYNFINNMKAGDIVLVPSYGTFSICEILDDKVLSNESLPVEYYSNLGISLHHTNGPDNGYLYYDGTQDCVDLGFYRNVKVLHPDLVREEYASGDLISSMKIMQTNADITGLEEEIKDVISRAEQERPIDLRDEIFGGTCKAMQDVILKWTDDRTFEQLVENYLRAIGADIVTTPAKNESKAEDGDADRVAYFEWLNLRISIQVKKHKNITGDWGVDQIIAYQKNHDTRDCNELLWLISSADDFTEEAKSKAKDEKVRLINGTEFARLLMDVGIKKLNLKK